MSTPVSVVIPTYNRAHLIGRTLVSALAAIGAGDEILVVDDASTDDTETVVHRHEGPIRYLRVPHGGAGAARNHGIRASKSPLVTFLDSDDEWDADKLRLQRALMDALPDVLFAFTDFRGQDDDTGLVEHHYLVNWSNDPRSWEDILAPGRPFSSFAELPLGRPDFQVHVGDLYLALMQRFYIAANTLIVRREAAGEALRFAEDVPMYEDLECFARLARTGKAAYMDCETATQHGHRGPRLTDLRADELLRARIQVLARVWGQDRPFLQEHGPHFQLVMGQQHLRRAEWLLVRGRTSEARAELAQVEGSPRSYRLLASLPGVLTKGLLSMRRAVRGSRSQ